MRTSLSPSSFSIGWVFDSTVPAILLAGVGKEFIAGCWDCCVDIAIEDGGVADSCCDVAAADDAYAVEEGDACCWEDADINCGEIGVRGRGLSGGLCFRCKCDRSGDGVEGERGPEW